MKIARHELFYKSNIVNSLITKEEFESKVQSKLKYAIQRFNQKVEKIIDKNKIETEEIFVRLASEDDKGNIITSEKGMYSYSKDNEIKKRKQVKDLENKIEDFEPFFFTDEEKISTFDEFVVEQLRGVFFPSLEKEEKIEQPTEAINP